jgi:glycosyltransferase involved in cell wall biosynthesis
MKIMLAFPRPLVPANTGGKIRSLQIFSRLSDRAEIHAISQADPELDSLGIQEMKQLFASYTPVFWKESVKYSLGFYTDLVKNRFSTMPYFIGKFCRPVFTRALRDLAASQRFDLLCCDFLQTATPALELPMRPRVVFEHNVEYILRKRQWETETGPLKKWVFAAEWKKTLRVEARVCRSFDHIIAVSDEDRLAITRDFEVRSVSTIPTGVDGDYFRPQTTPERPGRLVFVGSMDWYPNEDGVLWFLREIFPRIQREIPHATLTIVGRNPSSRLTTAASKLSGVALTGRVADVRPYLAEARAVVVPLRVGGGTRIKIPEAMAMGKAVVSTRVGAEGLRFDNRREILLEDEPEKFAESVIDLLKNAEFRIAIGNAARERVVRDHSWGSVVDHVEQILLRVKDGQNAFVDAVPSRQMANPS